MNRFRYGAVRLFPASMIFSGGPSATILPPSSPAPGPMSITQSLWADDVHVVLHHDHCVARIDQPIKLHHELLNVERMQARRRLIENIKRVPRDMR